MPKVGIKLLLISYFQPESFVPATARILLLTFCCYIVNHFEPFKFLNSNLIKFFAEDL